LECANGLKKEKTNKKLAKSQPAQLVSITHYEEYSKTLEIDLIPAILFIYYSMIIQEKVHNFVYDLARRKVATPPWK